MQSSACYNAVSWSLEFGYRLFDTAAIYHNERPLGYAIRDSRIPRSDVFVTTKVPPNRMGYESTIHSLKDSLRLLGFDYVDLYLIHWPSSFDEKFCISQGIKLRRETWEALLDLKMQGLCRDIGVCKFGIQRIHF